MALMNIKYSYLLDGYSRTDFSTRNIINSIKKISNHSFYSERPILLYSVETDIEDHNHWKFFKDGYRNIDDECFNYKNDIIKKCPIKSINFIHENDDIFTSYNKDNVIIRYKSLAKIVLEKIDERYKKLVELKHITEEEYIIDYEYNFTEDDYFTVTDYENFLNKINNK